MAPSGHRRNLQPKSSSEIFIRAVVLAIVSIKLVGPNTAVFGTIIVSSCSQFKQTSNLKYCRWKHSIWTARDTNHLYKYQKVKTQITNNIKCPVPENKVSLWGHTPTSNCLTCNSNKTNNSVENEVTRQRCWTISSREILSIELLTIIDHYNFTLFFKEWCFVH